jgi:hypothetical protein
MPLGAAGALGDLRLEVADPGAAVTFSHREISEEAARSSRAAPPRAVDAR